MLNDNGPPFEEALKRYNWRLVVATFCVAIAGGTARWLYSGHAGAYWWVSVLVLCVTGSVGVMLGIDVMERRRQLKQLRFIADAPKTYGFAGTASPTDAVNDMGRRHHG